MRMFKLAAPFLRGRNFRKRNLYESYKKGFEEEPSEHMQHKDFFHGYEDVIDVVPELPMRGMLTVCPTPIGNLRDITLRQYHTLKTADILACEDTRVTGLLLNLLSQYNLNDPTEVEFPPKNIPGEEKDEYTFSLSGDFIEHTYQTVKKTKEDKGRGIMISFNSYNQEGRTEKLIKAMKSGLTVALVSDAGTPLISDPGYYLVKECIRAGVSVESLPGPSAVITALVCSGFPTQNFYFQGFLSKTRSEKLEKLEKMKESNCTSVIFESSHRVIDTLLEIEQVFGEFHQVMVARELTKMHEVCYRGMVTNVIKDLQDEIKSKGKVFGELTVVVAPHYSQNQKDTVELDSLHLVKTLCTRVRSSEKNITRLIELITGWRKNKIRSYIKASKSDIS